MKKKFSIRWLVICIVGLAGNVACNENAENSITESNYVDIAAESVKFADVPATINSLNRVLVFSAASLHTAQGLSSGEPDDKSKMTAYMRAIRMGGASSLAFQAGPEKCPQGGERDNQIVSLEPDRLNMTVSLANCGYSGRVANGFVQVRKLHIQGMPLTHEVWTMVVDLYFDLTLSDAQGMTDALSLTGDANFSMTANGQLYSMSIEGAKLRVSSANQHLILKNFKLITANDSANGYYSISVNADYQSERFGEFHIKTDPHLIVKGGLGQCSGVLFVSPPKQGQGEGPSPSNIKIIANDDCIGLSLQYDKDGDGIFDANTPISWEFLSSL